MDNKCSMQFICHGNKGTCKHFAPVDLPDYPDYVCKYEANGLCTNETATREAKSE